MSLGKKQFCALLIMSACKALVEARRLADLSGVYVGELLRNYEVLEMSMSLGLQGSYSNKALVLFYLYIYTISRSLKYGIHF